jgi:hypothetical protein
VPRALAAHWGLASQGPPCCRQCRHAACRRPAGPVIRAEEGDAIVITLANKLDFAVNIEPGGVAFADNTDVAPGNTSTFE